MASTYTTSLKIQEIGNGEQSGVWGSTTNTNWTLIEQAVSGVQTITMSNANYTLTNLNGVLDEARNMVLVVSGTNSGIYQVIAPLVNKMYVVTNSTSGGYAITIGGSTGSVITVPNGVTVQVYCDGTNFYSAQTGSAGNFNVNGNLTVAGTSSFTGAMTAAAISAAAISGTIITASSQFTGPGTGLTGTASALTVGAAGVATTATNVASGAANQILYQTASSTTSFLTAPTSANTALVWNGSAFVWVAGTTPLANGCVYENGQTITSNYTMTSGNNGESAGPITVATGVVVQIPTGSRWVIN